MRVPLPDIIGYGVAERGKNIVDPSLTDRSDRIA